MRLLADENFDGCAVIALRNSGHDVTWIHDDSPGIADEEVWDRAVSEQRLLLTFDKDFGELAFVRMRSRITGIILFRLHGMPPEQIAPFIVAAITTSNEWAHHFSVVDARHIRMTPLHILPEHL